MTFISESYDSSAILSNHVILRDSSPTDAAGQIRLCVVCVRACVRACVCVCVRACIRACE